MLYLCNYYVIKTDSKNVNTKIYYIVCFYINLLRRNGAGDGH